jgi:sentrin-specific protease 8
MRPTLAALMVQAPRLKDVEAALPDFKHETHIFVPINDSMSAGRQADSGSHWSLLLVSRIDGVAFHYDSLNDHNDLPARAAVDRLSRHLRQPLRFYRIVEMPQQTNSSDCGVIVCILMRHLLVKKLLNANAREKVAMSLAGKQIDTYGGRKEMLKTIEQLRKEGERRRSTGALPLTIRSGNSPPYID